MVREYPWDDSKVTAFSFCPPGGGSVFYSSTPIDAYWKLGVCQDFPGVCAVHRNAMYVFTYDIQCNDPPTCPASPVLSASWLPPNNKMTTFEMTTSHSTLCPRLSLTSQAM
jgi:hypothetical protein